MSVQPSVKKAKVLVVDDDKIVLRAASEILAREGYTVVSIDDAVEGLSAAKDPSFDVAVLDIGLPGRSGYQVAQALRGDEQADGTGGGCELMR
jgi:two-component system response regulator HydG